MLHSKKTIQACLTGNRAFKTLIALMIIAAACSPKQSSDDKNFADLSDQEKAERFRDISRDFKGDYLIYSGPRVEQKDTLVISDTSKSFVELVMDSDNRFVIRTRFEPGEIKTDTMTISLAGSSPTNLGGGKWTDLGDKFEFKFLVGTIDNFFDDESNAGKVITIDNYTIQINKSVEELWIWQALCKKVK